MLVLDTSAIISVIEFEEAVTVPEVLDEIVNRTSKRRAENEIAAGRLRILEPDEKTVNEIIRQAKKTGESLSTTDIKLIALAKELDATLLTDDYGIQNICKCLDIEFQGIEKEKIKKIFFRKLYCPNCKKYYSSRFCPVCGRKLVRRVSFTR